MRNIVLIHGNSSSSRVFEPLIENWKYKTNLVSFDLPGHGVSERKNEYSWNLIKTFLLDKINEITGEKLLFGHSLGGHFAIEIAPLIQSLKGLVIFGAPPLKKPLNFEDAFIPNPYSATYFKESPEQTELENTLDAVVQIKSVIPLLREDFFRTDPKVRSAIGNDLIKPDNFLDQAEIFSTLKCSKYVINGTKDPMINFQYIRRLQDEALYSFKIMEIEECGHFPTLEKPKEVLQLLEKIHDEVFK